MLRWDADDGLVDDDIAVDLMPQLFWYCEEVRRHGIVEIWYRIRYGVVV